MGGRRGIVDAHGGGCRSGCNNLSQPHWALCSKDHRLIAAFNRCKPEYVTRLVESVDPFPDITAENCCLILGVGRARIGPGEFEIAMAHPVLHYVIDRSEEHTSELQSLRHL